MEDQQVILQDQYLECYFESLRADYDCTVYSLFDEAKFKGVSVGVVLYRYGNHLSCISTFLFIEFTHIYTVVDVK